MHGACPNVVKPEVVAAHPKAYIKIPAYVIKLQEPSRLQHFIEPNAGAHYYIETPEVASYSRATMVVDLGKAIVSMDQPNTRHAFISLTVSTLGYGCHFCDIGLGNFTGDPTKWFAHASCSDVNKNEVSRKGGSGIGEGNYIPKGHKIKIEYMVWNDASKDYITCNFFDLSDGGKLIASAQYNEPKGYFFPVVASGSEKGRPKFRFKRFMSLIPNNLYPVLAKDDRDYSKLEATIDEIKLYSFGSATPMAWTRALTGMAWMMQSTNMLNDPGALQQAGSGGGTLDYCSIYHQNRCH